MPDVLFGLLDAVEHWLVQISSPKKREEKQQQQNESDSAVFYLMRLGTDSLTYYLALLQKVWGFVEASSCSHVFHELINCR